MLDGVEGEGISNPNITSSKIGFDYILSSKSTSRTTTYSLPSISKGETCELEELASSSNFTFHFTTVSCCARV
jgi:hypothetical protein